MARRDWSIQTSRVFSGRTLDLAFVFICLLYLQLIIPAQMVRVKVCNANVLGSIPGVCILHFLNLLFQIPCAPLLDVHHTLPRSSHWIISNLDLTPCKMHHMVDPQKAATLDLAQGFGLSSFGPCKLHFTPSKLPTTTGPISFLFIISIFFSFLVYLFICFKKSFLIKS